ncbi:hypothetical protein BACSTE_00098 [Bacteroides stercoris ATCC 43183]|uniref:Uncharacterized protein n=1 Tax=Bacteroides stercoris ATCC 43183 TaxID=449673 RepID=B0NKY2_BACSE|nr:hypothetical protein BACSTE_00098 [Bacteroides stercoris ATCC 43183]
MQSCIQSIQLHSFKFQEIPSFPFCPTDLENRKKKRGYFYKGNRLGAPLE